MGGGLKGQILQYMYSPIVEAINNMKSASKVPLREQHNNDLNGLRGQIFLDAPIQFGFKTLRSGN